MLPCRLFSLNRGLSRYNLLDNSFFVYGRPSLQKNLRCELAQQLAKKRRLTTELLLALTNVPRIGLEHRDIRGVAGIPLKINYNIIPATFPLTYLDAKGERRRRRHFYADLSLLINRQKKDD